VKGVAAQAAIAMDNARLYEAATKERAEAESAALQAEESSRLKDEFLATISHELRTPLNAILGWSRMLRAGRMATDDAAKALDAIERNARAQSQLIADLLDVRIIAGKRMDGATHRPGVFHRRSHEAVE
jgi:signal transduction histidine kinase